MVADVKPPAQASSHDVPSGTYIELVMSLCDTRMPAVIMTVMFVAIGLCTIRAAHDGLLTGLVVLGTLASAIRLIVLQRGRQLCAGGALSLEDATRFEKRFALTYCTFAAIFGAYAARALSMPLTEWQMPVSIAVVGYAAGAASTIALRPRILLTSLMVSVLPPAGALLLRNEMSTAVSAAALLALLAGGLRSIDKRYVAQSTTTTKRHDFERQAETDHLTGVGNRLALSNALNDRIHADRIAGTALHYVDLDDFKAINDQLGHQIGDRLLRMVAEKLRQCGLPDDVIVRLGGDEFVVFQHEAVTEKDVELYAARISATLNTSYHVDGLTVTIGASVGSRRCAGAIGSMDALLASADTALRQQKIERKGRKALPASATDTASRDAEGARPQLLLLGIAKMTWEAAPDGMGEVDSPIWRAYTGQSYDDWKGFGWLTAIHPDDRLLTMGRWRTAVRDKTPFHMEYRLKGSDGRYRWMSVHALPLHNEDGSVAKWLGVTIDIDEARHAEQPL